MAFTGLRVISLESRRAADMENLIRRFGGVPFVAPALRERPIGDNPDALAFAERLFSGDFDMVIFMTGVGLGHLRDAIAARYPVEQFIEALRLVTVVARGPKPVAVLRQMGLTPDIAIPEPNTWREVAGALRQRPERRVAIQEYGRPSTELIDELRERGVEVTSVPVYRWEMPDDRGPLEEAVRRMAARECDVVLFTTSVQLAHLLEAARELGLERALHIALASHIAVASIGPLATEALASQSIAVDIEPESPKMSMLVKIAAERAASALARKRQSATSR
jgi:uroporphyrinogen-III synthase